MLDLKKLFEELRGPKPLADDTMEISPEEFEELKRTQLRNRWDWPAVFSTNCNREIWPFVTYGPTDEEEREQVRGLEF